MVRISNKLMCLVAVTFLVTASLFGGGGKEGTTVDGVRTLRIVGGTHLQNVLTGDTVGARGRNVIPEFEAEFNAKIEWITMPGDFAEVINRLGPLPRTQEDVIFFTGLYPSRRVAPFFADLKPFMQTDPLDDFPNDYSPGMLDIVTVDGKMIGLPYRAGTFSLWYNEKIFEERGISGPPRTPEEFYEIARQTTYIRDDGQKVFGLMNRGTVWALQEQLAIFARMWDGDPVGTDLSVGLDQQPVINAVELWRRMYTEGIIPGEWATMGGSEVMQHFKDGRAAMIVEGTNYWPRFNEAEDSLIRGYAKVAHMPLAREFWTAERDFNKSFMWFWNVGILQGSQNKDLAWNFIEFTAREDIQRQMARNENGPPRISTLEEQAEFDPGAILVAQQLPFSVVAVPPLDEIGEVIDIMGQAVHRVVVDGRPARTEMGNAAAQVRTILERAQR